MDVISQGGEKGRSEQSALDCLRSRMWSKKQPLIIQPVAILTGTDFRADAGRGQAARRQFDQVGASCNISSGRCNSAARIFDQRADGQISADSSPEALIRQADEGLYSAKAKGRNQVHLG